MRQELRVLRRSLALLPAAAHAPGCRAAGEAASPSATSASRACSASPKARCYNYLPVNIGDDLNPQRVREAMRALYATGFFRDVELRRDGGTLVVVVRERPSIESFEIKGNKDIKTEELTKSLRSVGLAAGKTFDRSVLEEVQRRPHRPVLQPRQVRRADRHHRRGAARQPGAHHDRHQGRRARHASARSASSATRSSSEKDILETFELKTPNWNSWYKQNDRYSREVAAGRPGEAALLLPGPRLRQFPDRVGAGDHCAREGRHVRHDQRARGRGLQDRRRRRSPATPWCPDEQLQALLLVQPGQTYSQQLIAATQELIENRLGDGRLRLREGRSGAADSTTRRRRSP